MTHVERVHVVPDGIDLATAVAAIGTGRTAVGLLDHAHLGSDDVVVVTAASGGLGSVLVRAAQHADATLVALAGGPQKVAIVRALGVSVVVDYREDGWDDEVREALGGDRATVVFDGVGGEASRRAFGLLAPGGTFVAYAGEQPDVDLTDGRSFVAPLGPTWMQQRPGGLRGAEEEALAAAAEGTRVLVVGSTFLLAEAAAAHRALETRETHGKVVLIAGSDA